MKQWWKSTVIYQIYPRSFYDSNNDGIGDLKGITQKLNYLNDGKGGGLGIETIWISPFFTSPMVDFGYDISNYEEVDPIFGTLKDFDELINETKKRGIRVIIDLVLNHTSDKHKWFEESKKDRINDKSDWYVWQNPKKNGEVPNNWLSIFGGSAWEFSKERGQYYLHSFLKEQPDLNWANPAVRKEMAEMIRFWMKRGVAGFRLDAVDYLAYDDKFRNNPKTDKSSKKMWELGQNPYFDFVPIYSKNGDRQIEYIEFLRSVFDEYSVASVCEISGAPTLEGTLKIAKAHTEKDKRVNMAYTFSLLNSKSDIIYISKVIETTYKFMEDSWTCFTLGNHDCTRLASRYNKKTNGYDFSRLAQILLLTLKGTPILYYADELNMTEYPIKKSELQDPFGINLWPTYKGRDGCRTPFPWDSKKKNLGFNSGAKTWLPAVNHTCLDEAKKDKYSTYYLIKDMLKLRKKYEVMSLGSFNKISLSDNVYIFEREFEGEKILCCFNFSDKEKSFVMGGIVKQISIDSFENNGKFVEGKIILPNFGAFLGVYTLNKN